MDVDRLRPVKKLLASLVAVVAVLAVASAIINLSEPRRAESARETLDRAASRFVQCYARDESYESCETGTSKLMVAERSKMSRPGFCGDRIRWFLETDSL
jgi:hypothetical protein